MQPTSKDVVLSSGSDYAFTGSLAQSVPKVWPIIISEATAVACAGLKRGHQKKLVERCYVTECCTVAVKDFLSSGTRKFAFTVHPYK